MNDIPSGRRIRFHANGRLEICGYDFEGRYLHVIARTETTIVIRSDGGSVWNGRCTPRRYVPAEIMVFHIEEKEANSQIGVRGLIQWEDSRKSKRKEPDDALS